MTLTLKPSITAALLSLTTLTSLPTYAQTLANNTAWLETQLNRLVTDDEQHNMNLNGKKSTPKFDFNGCQMNMSLDNQDKDVAVGMNMAWQLKDVRKISYQRQTNGQYRLLLDVPADKMKMNMGVGGFSGSFNMDNEASKGENAKSSFTLSTKDESLMRAIKAKFDESVQLCRKGRN